MGLSQGRGSAPLATICLCFFAVLYCCFPASATLWTVGDSNGWTLPYNYSTWTAGKTFKQGDVLFFPYAVGTHDVSVVNQSEYTSCTAGATTYTAGNTNITLTSTGQKFYICTIPDHCSAGMKLAIDVVAASAPISSPSKAPTPSHTQAPKSSPAKSPTPSQSPSSSAAPPSTSPSGSPSSSAAPPSPPVSSTPTTSPPAPPSAATSFQAGATFAAFLSILLGYAILIA